MKIAIKSVLIFTLFIASIGCSSRLPADFWLKFKPRLISLKHSDQGPYGGRRSVCWQAKGDKIFKFSEFKEFAESHGWKLQDSFNIKSSWLAQFNYFPFTYSQFSDSSIVDVGLPPWISIDAVLYRFSTAWVAIEPGNAKETNRNGYIIIADDGSRVAVYHCWGE